MFTGLVEDLGKVVALERKGEARGLLVSTSLVVDAIQIGDSIAVNGVCLTVIEKGDATLLFDVSPETLYRSTIGSLKPGRSVNLEQALRLSSRIGGHIVTGHVDSIATLAERREISGNLLLSFRLGLADAARYIIEKGSVTIDGASLTVNAVSGPAFSVNVIPHTACRTTIKFLKVGDEVNVETDIIGKYVEQLVVGRGKAGRGVDLELLATNGFL